MIADLKEKAAGLDRKRIYTAVAALLVAGAAGHFMQRTANLPGADAPAITGSVPAVAAAAGPVIVPPQPAEEVAAAVQVPETQPVEMRPPETGVADAMPQIMVPEQPPAEAQPQIAQAPVEIAPAADTETLPAPEQIAEAALAAAGTDNAPEVTRAPGAPLFDMAGEVADEFTTATAGILPAPETEEMVRIAAIDNAEAPETLPASPEAAANPVCDIRFSAMPEPGALVAVTVEAPCNGGAEVDFDHAGLRFSEQLGPDGSLLVLVPVMRADAVIQARLPDGQQATAQASVPDFADFERIAIVWKGATGLELHALENGADYGEAGHVWAEQPATPNAAVRGAGGFVSVLGSTAEGYAADVYTYPAALNNDAAGPEISIEAQVMENTCGSRVAGTILRSNPAGAPNSEDLRIAVPDCDAVGEYLVLKNLPQDLKLARN